MKIAFDTSDLCTNRADGTTRYTHELAKALPSLMSQDKWQFMAPCRVPQALTLPQNAHWRSSPWPKYWTQLRMPGELYTTRPDVLFMPIQQLPMLRPKKIKTVATVHDLAFHRFPRLFTFKDWSLLHLFTAQVVRQADQIIAVSQATADDIRLYYGRQYNIQVIHHGVDHKRFRLPAGEEQSEPWSRLHDTYPSLVKPYILFVGQVQPRKNLVRLIEAFELLHKDYPDLHLVLAGSHGWLKKPIMDRYQASPAKAKILWLGRVADELLPALYSQAEALVLPSLYEGFGMPILEAMACGCPVVTSNVSSMSEIAAKAAVTVNPFKAVDIARGIKEALADKEGWRRKGVERAKLFTWERCAQETTAVLKAL